MVLVNVDIVDEEDDMIVEHSSAGQAQGVLQGQSTAPITFRRFTSVDLYYSGRRNFYLFKGITIPQGSIIDDATLTLPQVENTGGQTATISIKGIKSASPALPVTSTSTTNSFGNQQLWSRGNVSGNANVGTAVKTLTFSISYGTTTPVDVPADVKDIVQEMVNSFDYNNDDMMFRVGGKIIPIGTGSGSYPAFTSRGTMEIQIYDIGPPDSVANLTINYTPASQEQFEIDAILQAVVAGGMKAFIINSILKGCRALPDSDISNVGNWSDFRLGNNDTELWDELNEEPPDNDGTAVVSVGNPTTGDTFEVNLEDCPDPLKSDGHIVRFTAKGSSSNVKVRAELRQGVTLIATTPQFIMSTSYQTFVYNLSGGEADSITDYTDLRVRIIPETV